MDGRISEFAEDVALAQTARSEASAQPAPCLAQRRPVRDFMALDVLREANARALAGHHLARLEIGQPGAPTPRLVREAAAAALNTEPLGYTDALGIPILRERIARHYEERHGVRISPRRVVITNGSSGGFLLSFLSLFDAGARVALGVPTYPAYANILRALEIEPVGVPLDSGSRWSLTPSHLDDLGHLSGVLAASPSNPTGVMMDAEGLGALVRACRRRGLRLISDEIYHGLEYGAPARSVLEHTSDAIVVNSFTKYYCMTGWRIGWLVVPDDLVRPMERLAQSLYISVPTLSQLAAVAAFDATEELEANKAVYARNRATLLKELPSLGFTDVLPADGAFYLWAGVHRFTKDSVAFASRLLHEANVAITPGVDFDPERGSGYVRLSFAGSPSDIDMALERLGAFLPTLR